MLQVLAISYFMAFVAALLKSGRYLMDYKRTGQRFYLVGVPANLFLALALALIVVASGNNPPWPESVMAVSIRIAIIAWAVLSLLFEMMYGRTYLVVTPTPPDEEVIDAHGD